MTYRSAIAMQLNGPEGLRVEELERRDLAPDEVRVRVEAASLTFMDLLMLRGRYQDHPPLPFAPGLEAAGVVLETGAEVSDLAEGDRVSVGDTLGCLAEEVVAKRPRLVRIGDLPAELGCVGRLSYGTALYALRQRGRLQKGEVLLVAGASGGVGSAAVELGRHFGAHVIAIVNREERKDRALRLGAEAAFVAGPDLVGEMKGLAFKGADVVLDVVGGELMGQCLRFLNWDARVLPTGFASGTIPEIPANRLLLKQASAIGVNYGAWVHRCPDENTALVEEIVDLTRSGVLNPEISLRYPLNQISEAVRRMEQGGVDGKIVITMDGVFT